MRKHKKPHRNESVLATSIVLQSESNNLDDGGVHSQHSARAGAKSVKTTHDRHLSTEWKSLKRDEQCHVTAGVTVVNITYFNTSATTTAYRHGVRTGAAQLKYIPYGIYIPAARIAVHQQMYNRCNESHMKLFIFAPSYVCSIRNDNCQSVLFFI